MKTVLKDQVCLVTGGAQGIGWAITQALAAGGGLVFACDISEEHLQTANKQLASSPWARRIKLAKCDVANQTQLESWINDIYEETKRIDVLINNAAFVCWKGVLHMAVEDTEKTMQVGFNAIVYGVKAVLPLMLAAGHGHIVNIGSPSGRIFIGDSSAAYAAVKAAVDGYTQTLQVELASTPIHVMLVRPSTVAGTDFFRKHVPSSRLSWMADFVPAVSPEDVAQAVIYNLAKRTVIVNLPHYLPIFYLLFNSAPKLFSWLTRVRGSARRDYGKPVGVRKVS